MGAWRCWWRAICLCCGLCLGGAVLAQAPLTALARVNPMLSGVTETVSGVRLGVALSQPVPWRVALLADPPRLVLDLQEADWSLVDLARFAAGALVVDARAGVVQPGWSRLVLELGQPLGLRQAGMRTDGQWAQEALITIDLSPVTDAEFAQQVARSEGAVAMSAPWPALPPAPPQPTTPPRDTGRRVVVLDPGHGGIDPGARHENRSEADLMLTLAQELREALLRHGGFDVVLTREDDRFVPLETRLSVANAAGAAVFISLHADAVEDAVTSGATIYTLSADASDTASALLAERHDRDDLLAGVDLSGQGDEVALILMDLARAQTAPRGQRLADSLVSALQDAGIRLHKRPLQRAAFSVLKSPDIPSVLIEAGFLSSRADRANLLNQEWRGVFTQALVTALAGWTVQEDVRTSVGAGPQ
jgi:N-acetylmuramoyl-L-alanine amidase